MSQAEREIRWLRPTGKDELMPRVNIKAILADHATRKRLLVAACITVQAREGIDTTQAQMEAAYDKVRAERKLRIKTERVSDVKYH